MTLPPGQPQGLGTLPMVSVSLCPQSWFIFVHLQEAILKGVARKSFTEGVWSVGFIWVPAAWCVWGAGQMITSRVLREPAGPR